MVILGISWGVTSTAAVMIDGRIVACASEERYNRIKNYDTWPLHAIAQCLTLAGIEAKDVDYVVWSGHDGLAPWAFLTHRYCNFSVAERVREQEEYWYPKLYDQREVDYLDVFPDRIDVRQFPGPDYLLPIRGESDLRVRYQRLADLRPRMVELQLGLPAEKNVFLNHHRCHAYYAACALPAPRHPLLVFTLDGSGDRESATVSVFDGRRMEKLYGSARFTGGRYYRHATLLLGMKMIEHEYKVMGLAPYAKPYYSDGPYQVYADTLYTRGLDFDFRTRPPDSYFYFKEKLKAMRFDGIAGGVQRFLEDLLCAWFQNWMEHTGIRRVAYSGGVAMNVKANLAILQRCQPEALLVPGSGSDESLAIGACYHFAVERGLEVYPLEHMYLGDDVTPGAGRAAAERFSNDDRYLLFDHFSEAEFARHVADGRILGRCVGRMEFGARALGNRSIIADPRDPETVRIVNDKIKSRDFWMPFAPAVLAERTANYLHLHPGADYGCMTLAAETTDAGRKCLKAALHPADRTARPQVVRAGQNPRFHAMIREFEKLTGVGAVLNTSLNIHGYPIVCTAEEALDVLERTDIDGMLVGDTLVLKRSCTEQTRSRTDRAAKPACEAASAAL